MFKFVVLCCFAVHSDERLPRRRRPPLLAVLRARTNLLQRAPLVRTLRMLNSLAEQIDLFSCSLNEFTTAAYCLCISLALSQVPADFMVYHRLHLPHDPPLYPTFHEAPVTEFTCHKRSKGYYADVRSGCQAYHFCLRQRRVSTDLCSNGTLFNEQFQVCDHFYNVRCGSPYEDL